MTPQIPGYLIAFELAVRPLVAAIALGLIWMGAARMEAPAQSRYMTAGALSAALIAWLAIAQYLGAANMYFATTDTAVPTVLFGLLIPLMIAAVGLWLSGNSQASSPRYRSIGSWRLRSIASPAASSSCFGRTDACPGNSRCPRGLATLRPASFAVVVAALLARKAAGARRAVYAWCLFGIADLVVAITMGAMTSPGRPHLFALEAPNLLISSYPLVMVPTFAVPLALMLHGLVLWRLRRETAVTSRLATA